MLELVEQEQVLNFGSISSNRRDYLKQLLNFYQNALPDVTVDRIKEGAQDVYKVFHVLTFTKIFVERLDYKSQRECWVESNYHPFTRKIYLLWRKRNTMR